MKTLSEVRKEKKITQLEMAEKLGVAVSTYNMYENGERNIPEKVASGISNVLGIHKSDFFVPITFTLSE
ncbi:helix-turn-helix domain-containing protein [Candidatus Formimonas warabiya]|uniref:Transcriptional regulator n=1 Tax=Formimonas warabiya TaxID=1761012 RepID=A0A3G1KWH6_FORW1|nr:helix-turn-helix transcriptional regulator [Candidatus Formimonas warabiya]ATW26747.1 transcriptional regulator [Candidatus Formimonas warabiya]